METQQQWSVKLGRIEEVSTPVMSAVTLTDVPDRVFAETKKVPSVPTVIRSASFHLQDGTRVLIQTTTYENMCKIERLAYCINHLIA